MIRVLVLYALAELQYITSSEVIVSRIKKKPLLVTVNFGKRGTLPIKRDSSYWLGPMTRPHIVGMV